MAKKKHRKDDDKHLYNLDMYLAKIIARELKAYEEAAVGVPSCLCYDEDWHEIPSKEADKHWHKILKKMIWSFNELASGRSFATKFNDFEKVDDFVKAEKKHQKKIDDGLKLFAEYFESLWI